MAKLSNQYRGERRMAAKAFGMMAKKETGHKPDWRARWRTFGRVAAPVFVPELKPGKYWTKWQLRRFALHFKSGIRTVSQRGEVYYRG
jgi:hypothetical protein